MGNLNGGVWQGPPRITGRGPAQFSETYAGMYITEDEARAAALNYFTWGADGISFWNLCGYMGESKQALHSLIHAWTHSVIDRDRLAHGRRWYHYLPLDKRSRDASPPHGNFAFYGPLQGVLGTTKTQVVHFPREMVAVRQSYKFRMADGRNGEKLRGILHFQVFHVDEHARLEIDVNGYPLHPARIRRVPFAASEIGSPGIWFEVALQDCPPFRGDNELGLILHSQFEGDNIPYMEELEIVME